MEENLTFPANQMNVTNVETMENETSLIISQSERVGVGVVFLITSILAIAGNVMVIAAVIRSKNLQTTTNAFVVCLSTANLVTGLTLPWSVVGLLSWEGWPMDSQVPCSVVAFFFFTSIGASLYSLAGIAINRMLSITASPSTYQRWYTPGKVAIMITIIWLLPFLTVLIPPFFDVGQLGYDETIHLCAEVTQHSRVQDQRLAMAMVFYPIPMLTLITSYSVILITIRRNFRHQFKATTNQPSDFDWGAGHESRRSRLKHQQLSITVNLFINVCVFLVLNLPFGITMILPDISDNPRITLFTGMVFLMHSFVHPILYGLKHPQFNQAFRQMLHLTEAPSLPQARSTPTKNATDL